MKRVFRSTGTLEAIATIKVTDNTGGPYSGQITGITETKLTKEGGGTLQTDTQLQVGDILILNGTGQGTASTQITIYGTIIVTKAGTLGGSLTLNGILDGTLTLSNGEDNNITVNLGATLQAIDATTIALAGINVTGSGGTLSGNATIEISTTNDTDDLTKITNAVSINVSKLTKGKVENLQSGGGQLTTKTPLANGDTLILVGTATAGDITGLNVTGTIKITTGGKLSNGLRFTGDVTSTNLTFENDSDGVKVTTGGTLILSEPKLTALQNTNFSLTSDGNNKHALTYKSELVTKSRISVGTITNTASKVTLSGLSIIPACITGTGSNNGLGATANLSLNHTQTATSSLKDPAGLNIDLTDLRSSLTKVTITKGTNDTVKNATGNLQTNTTLDTGDTLSLNITGGGTTLEGNITVTSPGKLGTSPRLSGGLTGTIRDLSVRGGTLTSTGTVNITNPKYDPNEFHVNHQDTHCCYWGGSHTPPWISTPESGPVTHATLNLSNDNSHTLTLKKGGGTAVQTTTVDVGDQSGDIDSIKRETDPVNIKLTLNLKEVTITHNTRDTLIATGSITVTRKVTNPSSNLDTEHDLLFTSNDSSLKQERLGTPSVTIGPDTKNNTLELIADPAADQNGKPTKLTLELKAGNNDHLTLTETNKTLNLSGGITGRLTYDSNNVILTARRITSVTYNLNVFHYTYNTKDGGHFWLINNGSRNCRTLLMNEIYKDYCKGDLNYDKYIKEVP